MSDSVRAILLVGLIGAFFVVVAPFAASGAAVGDDSAVGGDSAVGEDSPVAEDSAPRPETIVRIQIDVVNDNGGSQTAADFDLFVNSFGVVADGDVLSLPPGLRTISESSRGGYDITDMRCVRTSDGVLITQSFTVEKIGLHQHGLLRVPLNNGADITCSIGLDDTQVGFYIFPVVDDGSPVDGLITQMGDQVLVGEDSTLLDAGFYELSSGTPGYRLDRLVCTRYYRWSLAETVFENEIDMRTSSYDTACGAYFEKVTDVAIACERSGSMVSWTAPDAVKVHVRSSVDGWVESFVGSGSRDISGEGGDVFVRTRSKGEVLDTSCTTLPEDPGEGVACDRAGSVVTWTVPDGVKVHVRSSVDGWVESFVGSGSRDISGEGGEIFVRTRSNHIVSDTPC